MPGMSGMSWYVPVCHLRANETCQVAHVPHIPHVPQMTYLSIPDMSDTPHRTFLDIPELPDMSHWLSNDILGHAWTCLVIPDIPDMNLEKCKWGALGRFFFSHVYEAPLPRFLASIGSNLEQRRKK